jgi:hypothetical protein
MEQHSNPSPETREKLSRCLGPILGQTHHQVACPKSRRWSTSQYPMVKVARLQCFFDAKMAVKEG